MSLRIATAAVVAIVAAVAAGAATSRSIENGRAIFQTGRDLRGVKITAVPPPMRPSCAACHGADGSGGKHIGKATSADLRHAALVTHQKHPYTIALLERAISTGIDNEGKQLPSEMARWKMSKSDLHDVAEYVYTQLK